MSIPHNDDCQVHVVSFLHDRLVRAENTLLEEAAQAAHLGWGDRANHLRSKAEGVRLALSYCREEMR